MDVSKYSLTFRGQAKPLLGLRVSTLLENNLKYKYVRVC